MSNQHVELVPFVQPDPLKGGGEGDTYEPCSLIRMGGTRLALQNPNYRSEAELHDIREFKEAACRMLACKNRLVPLSLTLQNPAWCWVS